MLGTHRSVVVIGGGQAGLSMSYCLKQRGIDHVVLEKHRLGARVARAPLGLVLPGDAQLAVQAARASRTAAPSRTASC